MCTVCTPLLTVTFADAVVPAAVAAPPDSPSRFRLLETLSRANASTSTPTTRSTVAWRRPLVTSGTDARASSPGVVPTAKVAMMAPAASGDAVDRA